MAFEAGESIEFREPNAGGYGDPLERDPAMVREDVLDDFTTIELAREAYGVVRRRGEMTVDAAATDELRGAPARRARGAASMASCCRWSRRRTRSRCPRTGDGAGGARRRAGAVHRVRRRRHRPRLAAGRRGGRLPGGVHDHRPRHGRRAHDRPRGRAHRRAAAGRPRPRRARAADPRRVPRGRGGPGALGRQDARPARPRHGLLVRGARRAAAGRPRHRPRQALAVRLPRHAARLAALGARRRHRDRLRLHDVRLHPGDDHRRLLGRGTGCSCRRTPWRTTTRSRTTPTCGTARGGTATSRRSTTRSATSRGWPHEAALEDVRIVALEQYGAGPLGTRAPGRPRRRRHQDRGPAHRRRRRPLRAAVPGGRGLAVLRDLQPQQAQPSRSTCAHPSGPRRCSRTWCARRDAVYSNLRGDVPGQAAASRYDDLKHLNPQIVCCSLSGFGMTGPRARRARLRLHPAGHRRLDGPHRRARRPADQGGPVARRLLRRATSAALGAAAPACTRRGATASAATATSRCSTPRCTMLDMYSATWHLRRGLRADRARTNSAHPSLVPFQNFRDRRRLDRGRLREGEVLRAAGRGARPGLDDRRPALRRRWPRACEHREAASTRSRRGCCERRPRRRGWRALSAAGVPCGPDQRRRRGARATRRPWRAASSSETRASGARHRAADPLAAAHGRTPCAEVRRAPFRGEHTRAVLVERCGYSDARVDELAAEGVFGDVEV